MDNPPWWLRLAYAIRSMQKPTDPPYQPPIVQAPAEDPRLLAATRIAKSQFPVFLTAYAKRSEDERFAVKVAVPYGPEEDSGAEHMWFIVQTIQQGWIVGAADADAPLAGVRAGDLVKIKPSEVEDWLATRPDGTTLGGFSILALAKIHAEKASE